MELSSSEELPVEAEELSTDSLSESDEEDADEEDAEDELDEDDEELLLLLSSGHGSSLCVRVASPSHPVSCSSVPSQSSGTPNSDENVAEEGPTATRADHRSAVRSYHAFASREYSSSSTSMVPDLE